MIRWNENYYISVIRYKKLSSYITSIIISVIRYNLSLVLLLVNLLLDRTKIIKEVFYMTIQLVNIIYITLLHRVIRYVTNTIAFIRDNGATSNGGGGGIIVFAA